MAAGNEGIEPLIERDICPMCNEGYLTWGTEYRHKDTIPVRCTHGYAHGTDDETKHEEWETVQCSNCRYYEENFIRGYVTRVCHGYNN